MRYADTVLPIIKEVRDIVLPGWGLQEIAHIKSDHPADVVTEIDRKVEQFLSGKLANVHPDIEFVGEEFGGNRDAKRFWLCDPIDGTGHYIRGLPLCTTMLALIEDGIVTFSAVYDFVSDTLYYAERGAGAFMNNKKISVSNRNLGEAYLCYETKLAKKENQLRMGELEKHTGTIHTISAGWEFAMVAQGKFDGRISFDGWGKDYDFAPGSLLVSEAGGIVTNLNSDKYDYRDTSLIAANPIVYNALKDLFEGYKIPE